MPYKCWLTLSQGIFTFLKHVIDERRDLPCNHSNRDIFICEDIMFSRESSPGISLVFI